MRRRDILAGVSLAAAAIALQRAAAQQLPSRPARVGFVYFGPPAHADFLSFRACAMDWLSWAMQRGATW
jgi:hypothetical protein